MSVITTGSHPKALWPGVNAWFGAKYDQFAPEYPKIFEVQGSQQHFEEDVEHSGFGMAPVKPEGSGSAYQGHSQGYISRYTHVAYALGYIVTKEEQADNLYEKVSRQRASSLAYSMSQTRENVGANILNRAFSSSYLGGDGLELSSSIHTMKNGSTYANEITAADLSEASLEELCILIGNMTDTMGLKASIRPKCLIINIAEQFNAQRILKSVLQSDTANNAINALNSMNSIPETAVNHYLTNADAFFITTNAPEGLKWFDRAAVEFTHDGDFDTENDKSKAYMRFSAGWTDPRGIVCSEGA
jgi:hypothetical protein